MMRREVRRWILLSAGWLTAVGVGFGCWELYVHRFGATVEDLATVDLAKPMSAVESALPATHEHVSRVTTRFRHDVVGFEEAEIRFDETLQCAYSIELDRVKEKQGATNKKAGSEVTDATKLARWLPDIGVDGTWSWGSVSFAASDTSIMFKVKPESDNPSLHRQVDAAREVLLAVAFGRPTSTPDAELASLLGVGYPVASVGALDPTQDFQARAPELRGRFPSAVKRTHSLDIPLAHPSVRSAELDWAMQGRLDTVHLKMRAGSDAFRGCFSAKLPPRVMQMATDEIRVDVPRDALATFTSALAAVDACR